MKIKQKNMDLVARIILMVFSVIVSGIIIYIVKNNMDSTTDVAEAVVISTEEIAEEYAEYNISMYDGEEVRGSQLTNFIKKNLGDYATTETAPIYVEVITKGSGITYKNKYINKEHLPDIKNFSSTQYYVKPTASFSCEVTKSVNEAILGIKFTQK